MPLIWLTEKFDRDGILNIMTVYDELFDCGLNMVQDVIVEGADVVDQIFVDFEREVGSWHLSPIPPQAVASMKPDLEKVETSQINSHTTDPCKTG